MSRLPPYFDPHDVKELEQLVAKLAAVWNNSTAGPDHELERAARASLPGRLQSYAERFVGIATEARQVHRA